MTLDERLELAIKYDEVFGKEYGKSAKTIIEECKKLKVLGFDWGEISFGSNGVINKDFRLWYGGNLTNKSTNYEFDENKYYIHWDNGNVGRLMFLYEADYSKEETEIWEEFRDELLNYNPLDYDNLNDHMVYDIENGKRLMKDYNDICRRTKEKFNGYQNKKNLERAKKEYERLLEKMKEV